ncbi:GNAT family N-acetyltransferase [Rhizobiaceae bacterium BDR2-2]|uniref:GNAT family N-acetyltransferase n=1 Tax=Ectorhizobium quercum TaxID=2965071 RepID=A0AAE3STB9_9HYPH|nr:GNAT family N-acetyltransferase [Ectorhizobium quercum]MCX8995782.1 GNAT family N-acetyltransferase [Ectorhizobium quercum]
MLKYLTGAPEFDLAPMEAGDCAEVAALHAGRFPSPWGEDEFASLFSQETVYGFVARQTNAWTGRPMTGFVLAREVAGEAEILTIAVSERVARAGLGWRLMRAAMGEADLRGATEMFLEVDSANGPAVGLYGKLGFEKVGERAAYYAAGDGTRSTALVMRRVLG